jgi:hypothetical protein
VTDTGVAVAVTDTPGTAAVAETGLQPPASIHNHTGKPTCVPTANDGDAATSGAGARSRAAARRANVAGSTGITAPITASGRHTTSDPVVIPKHCRAYHEPATPGCASDANTAGGTKPGTGL